MKNYLSPCFMAGLLMLSGCSSVEKSADESVRPLPFAQNQTRLAEVDSDEELVVSQIASEKNDQQIQRDFNFPTRLSSITDENVMGGQYPSGLIKGIPDASMMVDVKLDFNAVDINEVVATFAAPTLLNFGYLVDPSVSGAVTMVVDTKMTAQQAWDTFEHILWLGGAYASVNPGFIHILPFDKMPQERRMFAEHELQPNVIVDFIPIKYKKSGDIANQLKVFMTEGANVTDLSDSNTLVIVEAPANIEKIRELVARLDNRGEREWPAKCFQCTEVEADVLAEELNQLLPVLGFPVATGAGASGGAIKVVALPRVGAVVVSAALPEVVDEVGRWVNSLDRSDMMDKEEIYFFNARHTTVDKLTQALEAFFNADITISETNSNSTSSSRSRSKSTSGLSSSSSNRSTTSTSSTSNRSSSSTSSNSRKSNASSGNNGDGKKLTTSVFDTEVLGFADAENNRITIKATPRTWVVMKAFLERHDLPPRQVSIQATIADISLTDSTEFGVSYAISKLFTQGKYQGSGVSAGAGALKDLFTGTMVENIAALSGVSSGLGLIIQHANDPIAFVSAVAGKGNVKILSEPQLVVMSGSEAYLQAGKKIAIATGSTTYTSSEGNTTNTYEYTDVGVLMTVTPYITAGHEVRLVIAQETSTPASSISNAITPDIETKKIETEMLIPDGATVMMGGMIQTTKRETRNGIPLLKDIPIIGYLFSQNSFAEDRTELLVMVTVNVIDIDDYQEELIRKYKASLEQIASSNHETY